MPSKNDRYRRIDQSWHGIAVLHGHLENGKRYLYLRWDDGIMTREPIHNHGDIVVHDEPMEYVTEWPWKEERHEPQP